MPLLLVPSRPACAAPCTPPPQPTCSEHGARADQRSSAARDIPIHRVIKLHKAQSAVEELSAVHLLQAATWPINSGCGVASLQLLQHFAAAGPCSGWLPGRCSRQAGGGARGHCGCVGEPEVHAAGAVHPRRQQRVAGTRSRSLAAPAWAVVSGTHASAAGSAAVQIGGAITATDGGMGKHEAAAVTRCSVWEASGRGGEEGSHQRD